MSASLDRLVEHRPKRGRKAYGKTRREHVPKLDDLRVPNIDAPVGAWAVDRFGEEFLHDSRDPRRIPNLRVTVCAEGYSAIQTAIGHLERWPNYRRMTGRFIADLKLISHLIERNKDLDPFAVLMASSGRASDFTEQLQEGLETVHTKIKNYLQACKVKIESRRNRDPLSSAFIMGLFENCWCDLMHWPQSVPHSVIFEKQLPRSQRRPFARFLAAAWRDLDFPLTDHRGQSREPLEDWFADRLRKDKRFRNLLDDDFEANSVDT